jgi:site-specific DNA-methyltransferase (adenine-specific)
MSGTIRRRSTTCVSGAANVCESGRVDMTPKYYEQDGCSIYHADCRDVLPELSPVDCVLTDPPYGIYASGGTWGAKDKLQWDRQTVDFLPQIVAMGRVVIIWGGNYYPLPPSRGWLVWRKPDRNLTCADVELAWTNRDMNARLFEWSIAATNAERVGHPTQKSVALMRWCLSFAPNSKTVLDPFMGSGSTLVAAKRHGCEAIGIELDEHWCEVAAKRLQQSVLGLSGAPEAVDAVDPHLGVTDG